MDKITSLLNLEGKTKAIAEDIYQMHSGTYILSSKAKVWLNYQLTS
jgi:hypothetical protein